MDVLAYLKIERELIIIIKAGEKRMKKYNNYSFLPLEL